MPDAAARTGSRDLVIARVGPQSLHPHWLDHDEPRSWDLVLLPYVPLPDAVTRGCVVADVIPGPKWSGLRTLLSAWDGWRDYERVWLPDDDLMTSQADISALFAISRAVGLELFAPALHDESYFAHFSTMHNRVFAGRWTGFVEIMMPGFRVSTLARLLPTLELTETGWGWGLDSLWPHLLGYRDVGIVDAVQVLHTRPVGQSRDLELATRVRAESDRIMREHGCAQVHATYAAFGSSLQRLDLSPGALRAGLVAGWQHLIDADARVKDWLVHYQETLASSPSYPIEGTPTVLEPELLGA